MSSLVRRIQRQVMPSNNLIAIFNKGVFVRWENPPPRQKFWQGRGNRLGVKNPKDAALLARLAREAKRRSRQP